MEDKLQQLLDKREIIHVVNSIGINADLRNWQDVSQAFADEGFLIIPQSVRQLKR